MSYFKIKSHAKVNLALNVVGKRASLHKVESIVSFLDLHDEIYIKKINYKNHKIEFKGKFSKGIKLKNTVSVLLEKIDNKKLLKNKYRIVIKKNIPNMAGLGGGSMNAANILKFMVKKKLIRVNKDEKFKIAKSIGSDVILGLYYNNLVLRSDNSIKSFSIKKKLFTLIVKPNFGCSTKEIYSKIYKFSKSEFKYPTEKLFNSKVLVNMKNDLEPIVLANYPKIDYLKKFLNKLSKTVFVRMTGSGSAIIAYFNSAKKCEEAKKKVNKRFKNYWCETSKTI